jgi:hypothetical protein
MDLSWEHLSSFAEEQWWVILIAALVLIVVIKVVKTLVKWLIVAVILIALVVYGMNYEPIREVVDTITETSLDAAFQAIVGETGNATYTEGADNTFTVESNSIKLTGTLGSDKVTIYFHGVKVGEVSMSKVIESYIEAAKGAGK